MQFLPPLIHSTPQRRTHLPHPSFFYEWRSSEAGAAFFRLAATRQAEELAAYDLNPRPIPKTEVPFSAPARPAAGGKRAVSRPTVPGAPPRKKARRTVQSESDEPSGAEEEAVTQAHSEGMLPILLADLGRGGHRLELELHTSPHAAQDTLWAGSSRWQKAEVRPEVVMQSAMMECPLWARAGIHPEGTRAERSLNPETFLALASILPVNPQEYWASYDRLIVRLLAWIQNTDPGTPEISDIAQAVRALSEPRGHRILGRARTCRANPVETQHLAPDPHGGSFPPPTDVVQVIRNGLRDATSPCLTVARLLGAFTTPVDSLTANWLALAEYNGGVYPGLAGEAVTIDRRTRGPALRHNHGYEPLQESVLHVLCHVATGMPLPGDALSRGAASSSTDPLQQTGSSAGSAAEFEVEVLSSGQEQSGVDSDGGSLARRIDPLAHVGGARLVSLQQLLHRLTAVPAVSGPTLEGFRPAMALASWKHGTPIPQLLTLGTNVAPSVHLLVELRYTVAAEGKVPVYLTQAPGDERTKRKACHRVFLDCHLTYTSQEEAEVMAQGCPHESKQRGPGGQLGFLSIRAAAALPSIEEQLTHAREAEGFVRVGGGEMGADRRAAAGLFLPACESALRDELAAVLSCAAPGRPGVGLRACRPATAAAAPLPPRGGRRLGVLRRGWPCARPMCAGGRELGHWGTGPSRRPRGGRRLL